MKLDVSIFYHVKIVQKHSEKCWQLKNVLFSRICLVAMLLSLLVRTADTHNRPVPHISGHAGKLHFMEVSCLKGGSSGKSLETVGIHLDEARKFRQAAGKGLASNLHT